METKKLEALVMAVDLGSFTRASEVLGYTQSGLTHMMNSLEKEVGFPLLVRGREGVHLTPEGELVAPAIRDFLQANSRLNTAISRITESGPKVIRVSAYASVAMHWLPSIIQQFRTECPDVDVDIRMADHVDGPYMLLSQGKMDAIFVSRQSAGDCDWIPLKNDPMYAVLPKNYPIQGETFPVEEFDGREFIMPSQGFDREILETMQPMGIRPHIRLSNLDDPAVISMVEHGLGISMMTELTLKGRAENVRVLPVAPPAHRELGLAVQSEKSADPALKKFIECTCRIVSQLS